MFDEKLSEIEVDGVSYPMAFNLNVMERIQEEYGSMTKWSELISPKDGEPNFKTVIFSFKEFINEGIDIENDDLDIKRPFLTHKQSGRLVTKAGLVDSANAIAQIASDSTNTGDSVEDELEDKEKN